MHVLRSMHTPFLEECVQVGVTQVEGSLYLAHSEVCVQGEDVALVELRDPNAGKDQACRYHAYQKPHHEESCEHRVLINSASD